MMASNYMLFPCLDCGHLDENLNDAGLCISCQVDLLLDVDATLDFERMESQAAEGPHTLIVDSCPIMGKSGVLS